MKVDKLDGRGAPATPASTETPIERFIADESVNDGSLTIGGKTRNRVGAFQGQGAPESKRFALGADRPD
jgi:hypothetical protein